MTTTTRLRVPMLASGAVLLAVLAGCGSGSGDAAGSGEPTSAGAPSTAPTTAATDSSTAPTTEGGSPTSGAGSATTTVAVTETEFHIAMDTETLPAGTYTFQVTNAGSITHALTIDGPGVVNQSTGNIDGGSSGSVTVTLTAGTYDVYCPVGDHQMEGMDEKLSVT